MKKFGFTLAEILITLSIIGVIATLTLPGLSVNIHKQQAGTAFMKAVNTLKTTNMAALQDNQARYLNQIPTTATNYLDETLEQYIQWSKVPRSTINIPYGNGISSTSNCFTSPDGITYMRNEDDDDTVTSAPRGYTGEYMVVYIDVNGYSKGPNSLGRDVFKVLVDQAGQVIPYGSYFSVTYGATTDNWETKCTAPWSEGQDPAYCAGAIADNGGQIRYKF